MARAMAQGGAGDGVPLIVLAGEEDGAGRAPSPYATAATAAMASSAGRAQAG